MLPSATLSTAFSGSVISLFSSSTSTIRFADAPERVSITNIIESILRLISICILYVSILDRSPTLNALPPDEIIIFAPK